MRTYHWLISVLFGTVILITAAAAAVRAVPYDLPQDTPVLDGGLTRSFESHYDQAFPVKTFGTNLWGAIQYLLFGEGRSGVVVGADGWLYTREEFTAYPDGDTQVNAHLDLIGDVQRRLRERGTELTVAVLPAKARLYPEFAGAHRPAEVHIDLYARVLAGLAERGVTAPDLLAPLARCKQQAAVFLRTDTHWTPEGAHCSAQALAAVMTPKGAGATRFVSTAGQTQDHQGDLMKFLPLSPYFAALMPPAEQFVARSTVAASSGSAQADLLGDAPEPTVVLVGTSYSADQRWNFDGALRESLGEDVLNLAESGHGPFKPMLAYLDQPPQGPVPARLIWEVPERYLPASTRPEPDRKTPEGHHGHHAEKVASLAP